MATRYSNNLESYSAGNRVILRDGSIGYINHFREDETGAFACVDFPRIDRFFYIPMAQIRADLPLSILA